MSVKHFTIKDPTTWYQHTDRLQRPLVPRSRFRRLTAGVKPKERAGWTHSC